jgi:hypothetical protein
MKFRPTRERHKNQSIVQAKAEISFEDKSKVKK